MLNSCYYRKSRFGLGVHSKRFLAVSELANELMGPVRRGGWGVVGTELVQHSIINEELYSDDEGIDL